MSCSDLLKDKIIDPNFSDIVNCGKYSQWARNITCNDFIALTEAIGELAEIIGPFCIEDKDFLAQLFSQMNAPNSRGVWGLDSLLKIASSGTFDWHMPSGWDQEFEEDDRAFSPSFQETLRSNSHTEWASCLSTRLVGLVIWMTGELCIRVPHRLTKGEWLFLPGLESKVPVRKVECLILGINNIYQNIQRHKLS